MKCWLFLAISIIAEVSGTLSMKYASLYGGQVGHLVMYAMITLSYVALSVAIKRIALGVAYALWEGVGVLLITLCSVTLFAESLPLMKALGLLVLVAGIVLLNGGTDKADKQKQEKEKGGLHAAA
ncbi:multidrug/spermidine efflux SMR transporter subunit MdtJ [Erwinia sp. PK3-005]|uniref:Spermidine export protein MdtJ n=1 Tax=Mixta hanseatica TaxID=2872648 RepID=A0ABY4R7L8_9GAMM|nr:multidrug/spermidine efflux SMR transporter subunit MdtJ [Mixta hanseatica]UQY42806.1 multidrug/spermidine efflux SMR transporter subunit MdtJ [Mixta hanseatica]